MRTVNGFVPTNFLVKGNKMEKQLITHSRASCFKACRRQHWYSYELGMRRVDDAKALRMGQAFHAGVEQLSKRKDHVLLTPKTCRCNKNGSCPVCDHELAVCSVCKGGESDLSAACNLRLACAAVRTVYSRRPDKIDEWTWEVELETILRLVCGYQWRWHNDGFKILATERPFRLPLVNPATNAASLLFDLAGKIDGIVQLEDGRLAVKETKTTGEDISDESDYWRTLRIDQQISLYLKAARRLGYDVSTVLYDVCRKPAIAPEAVPILDANGMKIVLGPDGERVKNTTGAKGWRQSADKEKGYVMQTRIMTPAEWGQKLSADIAERPQFYFARKEIPRLDADINEAEEEIWQIQQTLRETQRTGKHYRTVSRNCKFCAYFEPCTTGQDVSVEAPQGFTFVTDPHPELNGACNVQPTETTASVGATSASSVATASQV